MPYLYETHLHTAEVSPCAHVPAARGVELYLAAGYDGIVVTDHFLPEHSEPKAGECYADVVARYLMGYRAALKAAAGRLTVLLGMELRFEGSRNDYLVYGITENVLLSLPGIHKMVPREFSVLAREKGLLFYQAHPFRNGTRVIAPEILDGIETRNGNPRHDSRNDIAAAWAEKFGLSCLSGSDFHEEEDVGRGGIYSDSRLTNREEWVAALKNGVMLL